MTITGASSNMPSIFLAKIDGVLRIQNQMLMEKHLKLAQKYLKIGMLFDLYQGNIKIYVDDED